MRPWARLVAAGLLALAVSRCAEVASNVANQQLNAPGGERLAVEGTVSLGCATPRPIANAVVELSSSVDGPALLQTTTDAQGRFRFLLPASAGSSVVVSHLGFSRPFSLATREPVSLLLPCPGERPFAP